MMRVAVLVVVLGLFASVAIAKEAAQTAHSSHFCDEPDKDEFGRTKVAFLIPTTSHGLPPINHINDIPFMKFFYASLQKTFSKLPNLEYHLYLGFDPGDAWFDNREHLAALMTELLTGDTPFEESRVHFLRLRKGPDTKLTQLWNQLFQMAFDDGMHYFYQIGDDVQFETPGWTEKFVSVLQSNPTRRNFGVVGPRDKVAPQKWQEQAFVHRTHYHTFGYLFDPHFHDGSCDVWLAQAYGKQDSFLLNDVMVTNQIRIIRYNPHPGNTLVGPRVQRARRRACEYIRVCMSSSPAESQKAEQYCRRVEQDEIVGTFLQIAERMKIKTKGRCIPSKREFTEVNGADYLHH